MELTEATLYVTTPESEQPIEVQGALFHYSPGATSVSEGPYGTTQRTLRSGKLKIICQKGAWWSSASSIEIHPLDGSPFSLSVRKDISYPHHNGQEISYYANPL